MSFFGIPGAVGSYEVSETYQMVNSYYESIDPGLDPDYSVLTINEDRTITDAAIYNPSKVVSTLNKHIKTK